MPSHHINVALKSRGYDPDRFHGCKCERCEYKYFHPEKFPEFSKRYRLYATLPNYQDVHHIDSLGGKHNYENRKYNPLGLILLCKECHAKAIHGNARRQEHKKIVFYKVSLANGDLKPEYKRFFSRQYNARHS